MEKRQFLDKASVEAAIARLSEQVVRDGIDNLALVGIKRRGVPIAERMKRMIEKDHGVSVRCGTLDITLYRDDLSMLGENPQVKGGQFDFDLKGLRVVLIDDVLFTGRTIRAAMDALIRHGRPAKIELAVLVDRGWREFPIEANYAPHKIATTLKEVIKVHLEEIDGKDAVEIVYLEQEAKSQAEK